MKKQLVSILTGWLPDGGYGARSICGGCHNVGGGAQKRGC